jgi:hypothetical protein
VKCQRPCSMHPTGTTTSLPGVMTTVWATIRFWRAPTRVSPSMRTTGCLP